jgi:Fe-S cluster assembly protein SufD
MEIYADDVQAVHGATAGAVAEDALMYMRSRGIDKHTAMSLLVNGFTSEIIDEIKPAYLRGFVGKMFSAKGNINHI